MLSSRPKNDKRYIWTNHSGIKMAQYGISPSFVKRIMRFPERTEEGIAENTVAVMKPTVSKKQEVWVMYQLYGKRIKIITAWKYPGKSSERDPIPDEIKKEIRDILSL